MRTRTQTAQHDTTDVHTIMPGGAIRVVAGASIRATRKHDECRYQTELKEHRPFHQGQTGGHGMGKSIRIFKCSHRTLETDKYINMGISGTVWKILSIAPPFHSGWTDWVE